MMIWLLVVCIARPVMANNSAKAKMIYKDAYAPLENRVEDLLSRMTLKEKVLQLNQYNMVLSPLRSQNLRLQGDFSFCTFLLF